MYQLVNTDQGLCLCSGNSREHPIRVDFSDPGLLFRAQKLMLSKDGLVKSMHKPDQQFSILDTTAGLGQDSFLLAWLGHDVTMLERSLPIAQLLEDGLARGLKDPQINHVIQRMHFIQQDSILFLNECSEPFDIIYCDPMFPASKKSRLVRKSMRALSHMVGTDHDADDLLRLAMTKAKKKVVVKRPRLSDPILPNPNHYYEFQACRFDVYLP